MGFVGALGVLAFLWINLGGRPQAKAVLGRPAQAASVPATELTEEDVELDAGDDEDDYPNPWSPTTLTAPLRERKLAKIAAAQAAQAAAQTEEDDDDESGEVVVEVGRRRPRRR